MFAAIGLAWKLGGFGGVLKLIPRWLWIALGVIALLTAAFFWHRHAIHQFEDAVRKDEHAIVDAAWQKRFDAMQANAGVWKQRYEAKSSELAQARSNIHEKNLQSIGARSDALLVRGPGAAEARCGPGDHPGVSSATGQYRTTVADAYAAGSGVPSEVRASVPWPWLVIRSKEHDELLSEVAQWHIWYPEQAELLAQQKRLLIEQNKQ